MKKISALSLFFCLSLFQFACNQSSTNPVQPSSQVQAMTGPPTAVLTLIATHNPHGGPPGQHTPTPTDTPTSTPTDTATLTSTSTLTSTPTLTATQTVTDTLTSTATSTPTATFTPNCCQAASPWTNPVFSNAAGVAVDRSRQRVYAPDRGTGTLFAFNYDGTPAAAFGSGGSVAGLQAFSVAVGPCAFDGVYIVQRNNPVGSVVKLDANGNVVWTSANVNGGANRSVYVDDAGTVYVCSDTGNIFLLDSTGTLQNVLTGYGLNAPTGTFKVGTTLYVTDTVNNRIVSLPQTGAFTYGALSVVVPSVTTPYVITGDLAGNFYVASANAGAYFVYNSGFSLLFTCANNLSGAFGIAVDQTGSVYVAKQFSSPSVVKNNGCILQPPFTACP